MNKQTIEVPFVFKGDSDRIMELINQDELFNHLDQLLKLNGYFLSPVYQHLTDMYDTLNDEDKRSMIKYLNNTNELEEKQYLIHLLIHDDMHELAISKASKFCKEAEKNGNYSLHGAFMEDVEEYELAIESYIKGKNFYRALEVTFENNNQKLNRTIGLALEYAYQSKDPFLALYANQFDIDQTYDVSVTNILNSTLENVIQFEVLDTVIDSTLPKEIKTRAYDRKIELLIHTEQLNLEEIEDIIRYENILEEAYNVTKNKKYLDSLIEQNLKLGDFKTAKYWAFESGSQDRIKSLTLYERLNR